MTPLVLTQIYVPVALYPYTPVPLSACTPIPLNPYSYPCIQTVALYLGVELVGVRAGEFGRGGVRRWLRGVQKGEGACDVM